MINRTMMAFVLCLLSIQIGAQSSDSKNLSLKKRLHHGEKLMNVRVPTDADREKVHAIIKEKKPDMLYLDAHHHPCTEWDISRICKAAQELNVPVMMRIDHADQAGIISSMLDLGLFSIKVPTVEDEETVQKIINGFYFPPLGKRSLGGSNNYGRDIAKREGKPYWQWWNENAILGCKLETLKGVLNTPPCGVPCSVRSRLPLAMQPALRKRLIRRNTRPSATQRFTRVKSFSWSTDPKKSFKSASTIHS